MVSKQRMQILRTLTEFGNKQGTFFAYKIGRLPHIIMD